MINKLVDKIKETNAPIVVGLDPMLSYVPEHIQKAAFAEFGETPAGAAEAIAAICAMNNSLVPPTINLQEQDEVCDLHYTPNVAEEAELEAVLSTSLGFGGHNACIAFRKFKG